MVSKPAIYKVHCLIVACLAAFPVWAQERGNSGRPKEIEAASAAAQNTIAGYTHHPEMRADAESLIDRGLLRPFYPFDQLVIHGDTVFRSGWSEWSRCDAGRYFAGQPVWKPAFEIQTLSQAEPARWMPRPWANLLPCPDSTRAMVVVTQGGFDRVWLREIDTASAKLISDGFSTNDSRSFFQWISQDKAFIGTDTGPMSLTRSGYPRMLRVVERGQDPADAKAVFVSERTDAYCLPVVLDLNPACLLAIRHVTSEDRRTYICDPDKEAIELTGLQGLWVLGVVAGEVMAMTTTPTTVRGRDIPAKSVISLDPEALRSGKAEALAIVYEPPTKAAVQSATNAEWFAATPEALYLRVMNEGDVRVVRIAKEGDRWSNADTGLPASGVAGIYAVDTMQDSILLSFESPGTPAQLYASRSGQTPELLDEAPAAFDASELRTERRWAISQDGTQVPYLIIRDARTRLPAPTIIHGYGASGISTLPKYRADFGKLWLERGGVLVLAQVRGGSEFGPVWSEQGRRDQKARSFDDLIATAESVIDDGVSTAQQIGLDGISAGGLLVVSTALRAPALFGAVVARDPLLDVVGSLSAPGSPVGTAEYGDPTRAEDVNQIRTWEPTTAVQEADDLPPTLLLTRTNDQRVPSWNARKFFRLATNRGLPVMLFESETGDHGTIDAEQLALRFAFFSQQLGLPHAP